MWVNIIITEPYSLGLCHLLNHIPLRCILNCVQVLRDLWSFASLHEARWCESLALSCSHWIWRIILWSSSFRHEIGVWLLLPCLQFCILDLLIIYQSFRRCIFSIENPWALLMFPHWFLHTLKHGWLTNLSCTLYYSCLLMLCLLWRGTKTLRVL